MSHRSFRDVSCGLGEDDILHGVLPKWYVSVFFDPKSGMLCVCVCVCFFISC